LASVSGRAGTHHFHNVSEMDKVQPGDVLVSDMTDSDWKPVMKRASAIVTNPAPHLSRGIIAAELGYSSGRRHRQRPPRTL